MDGSTSVPQPLIDPSASVSLQLPAANSMASRILGLRPILQRYEKLPETDSPSAFAETVIKSFGVFLINEGQNLESMPKTGPAIFYANHPFGGIEGVILAARCGKLRPDFKLIANRMLARIPELRPMIIPIDVSAASQKENFAAIRAAVRHVEDGGAVGIFPSGVVAHWQMKAMAIRESVWYSLCGRLGRIPNVTAIPMYFKGTNSAFFHAAGCIHPFLRTLLLPRQLWRSRGRTIRFVVGNPIENDILLSLPNSKARTAHMRERCEQLNRPNAGLPKIWSVPVAPECAQSDLCTEVEKHLQKNTLVTEDTYKVFTVRGDESPLILQEIGRLREKTFRLVGEGSGQERDLDHYDPTYTHLVLWDSQEKIIAGAYRVRCFTPEEKNESNEKLYTASLFRYKPKFFEHCQKSLELGRAFIAPDYQRDYKPLFLLWKGIGRMIVRHKLRTLFGPCSIGLGYTEASIYMLRQLLKEQHWSEELAALSLGKRTPSAFSGENVPDVHGLDYKACHRLIKDIEGDKGIPILFKHYLQLGGVIAAFHEDITFGTLDALLVVDLAKSADKVLLRYMDSEELATLRQSYTTSC